MPATYVKYLDFAEQIGLAEHNLNTDTHRVALTASAITNTNTILSNITQIASGNGYTTNGEDAQNVWAETAGTGTLTGTNVTWTAGPAAMATARSVIYYSNQTRGLVNPLICGWDYGAGGFTLNIGETFSIKFNSGVSSGTVFTLA